MEVFGRQDLGFEEVVLDLRALDNSLENNLKTLSSTVSRKRSWVQSLSLEKDIKTLSISTLLLK